MKVSQLFHLLAAQGFPVALHGAGGAFDPSLLRACFDSRRVLPGDVFCALAGGQTDGCEFLESAFEKGAAAFMVQGRTRYGALPHLVLDAKLNATECRRLAGYLAHILSGRPSESLWVGAVTGTNGKSTIVHLLEQSFAHCGIRAGAGGTLGLHFENTELAIPNTTPSADILHDWMRQILHQGGTAAVFEASSVGIQQQRLSAVAVDCAAWTNLSHDHLDMHGTMDAYAAAKAQMFLQLNPGSVALLPDCDDLVELCASSQAQLLRWGLDREQVDLGGCCMEGKDGVHLSVHGVFGAATIHSPLIGAHNAENLLLAFAMLRVAGVDADSAGQALSLCTAAPGRLQRVCPQFHARLFVDYAHSPEALEHALHALAVAFPGARLGVVFGAGGDRDCAKREPMGRAVGKAADWCIVTSDNPRGESPEAIACAVRRGVEAVSCPVQMELDRRAAIHLALEELAPLDVLLVAGKGHETYQEVCGVRHAFDDRCVLEEAVACLA